MKNNASIILDIKKLSVTFKTHDGDVQAVKDVSMQVFESECVGIVGESGSGKTQTFLATMGLLPHNAKIKGESLFDNKNLLKLLPKELNQIRGSKINMIFQDPLTSLTLHMRIGEQMVEILTTHKRTNKKDAQDIAIEWLKKVKLTEAEKRFHQYPHELSGGMRQRVMIAMAMLCQPKLLIADEPTTALDVTIQSEILDLLYELKSEHGVAIVLITHDMGVVARMCDRAYIMQDGEYIESADINKIFYAPEHEYTKKLISSMPTLKTTSPEAWCENNAEVLKVNDLSVSFKIRSDNIWSKSKTLKAVNDINFSLREGETLGIVGESGCGKSTLARAILRLVKAQSGSVSWLGKNFLKQSQKEIQLLRKEMQIIFQDPLASLNPCHTIAQSIMEPLKTFYPKMDKKTMQERVVTMMRKVGLDHTLYNRYPHELSGGQNQRVGIARSVILNPKLLICDEPVSALDVSIQTQIIELLQKLQKELRLSIIFISHDLSVVKQISHNILVMYLGNMIELADGETLINSPHHPYTQQLISAVPVPDPKEERNRKRLYLKGELTSPLDPDAKFRFIPSKSHKPDYIPKMIKKGDNHFVAEHDPIENLLR